MVFDEIWSDGKYGRLVAAGSLLCYWLVRELGVSMEAMSRRLNICSTAVSKSVLLGEKLANENQYILC